MSLPEVANLVETCGCFGLVWQATALRFSFRMVLIPVHLALVPDRLLLIPDLFRLVPVRLVLIPDIPMLVVRQ